MSFLRGPQAPSAPPPPPTPPMLASNFGDASQAAKAAAAAAGAGFDNTLKSGDAQGAPAPTLASPAGKATLGGA